MKMKFFVFPFVIGVLIHVPSIFNSLFISVSEVTIDSPVKPVLINDSPDVTQSTNITRESLDHLYDTLQPRKVVEEEVSAVATTDVAAAPVVDKTLLPNFLELNNDNQVGLKGIFNGAEVFAVIEVKNFETKESQFLRVEVGQTVYGFVVTEISGATVVLQKEGSTDEKQRLNLVLFR